MEPHDPAKYSHKSPRAEAALERCKFFPGGKGRLFELALPRDHVPGNAVVLEQAAQEAAAKLIARHRKLAIVDVWSEDGLHPEFGAYRIWFLLTAPVAGRA